jgi:hypothetical protein
MMKELTIELAGIAPYSCSGGEIPILCEKYFGWLIFLCTFTDCALRQ